MGRRVGGAGRSVVEGFPAALAMWLRRDGDVLEAIASLRRLGPEAAAAVEAVLAVRRVAELKASWALWEALVEGDGEDADALLCDAVPVLDIDGARRALWGASWRDCETPRLTIVP